MRATQRLVRTFIGVFVLMGIVFPATAGTDSRQWWDEPGLDLLIQETLDRNNELQSLQEQVNSQKSEVPFAGSLEDPKLSLGVLNLPVDSFSFEQEPMTQKQVALSQKFPWFGKLDLQTQKAVIKALRQQAVLEAKRLELVRQVAGDYFELTFVDRSLEINGELAEIVKQLLQVSETRYATGQGLQQDVLQAQVELGRLTDERIELQKRRRILEDRLNGLMNREAYSIVQPAEAAYADETLEKESLLAATLERNPLLKIRQADVDLAALEIDLAEKDYWPDMDVRVAYGQREEDRTGRGLPDFFSAAVTFNIPLWQKNRQDSKLAAAKAGYQAALKAYRNVASRLPYQLDALITEVNDTQANYEFYTKALMLQADHWAQAATSAYEVGKVEFNTMINARINLLRFEQQALRYRKTVLQKRAEIGELSGTLLPNMVGTNP
jgi:outer membrane protein TolC